MSQQTKRLLITGASGQLAKRTAELVLEKCSPKRLILVTRDPLALVDFAELGVDVRIGDFADPKHLSNAFRGASRMLLVSITDLENRAEMHGAAIDAAAAAGVEHIIYTSGLSPAPPNPAVVAASHYATEQKLAAAGINWTVLRNSLYADYQASEAAHSALTGKLIHNRREGRVAYVSREDCAAVAATVLAAHGHENVVYDITGPETFSATDLARLYGKLAGRPIETQALEDSAFVTSLVGDARDDDHMRYGAELVASFGQSIREGYMDSCTDTVSTLTGRPAQTLGFVLKAAAASS